MDVLDYILAFASVGTAILIMVYAVKTYRREPEEWEILPWDPTY